MVKAYLGLGSNIGNRELQLNEAIKIKNEDLFYKKLKNQREIHAILKL